MKIRNQVWALGILLLATGLTQGSCDLWRQWTESGDLAFRWKAEVGGRLLAPPLADQGRVFAATHDDDARFSTVVGFDAASGKQLWKFTPPEKEMSEHSMLASGGKLFFPALGGVYYCLDGATGQVVWKTNLGRESFKRGLLHKGRLYIPGSLFYPSRSPVVKEGWARLFIVDPATGKIETTVETENNLLSTPAVDDEALYVIGQYPNPKPVDEGGHTKLQALDIANGYKPKWTHITEAGFAKMLTLTGDVLNYIAYRDDIYGVDRKTGKTLYKAYTGNWSYGFAVVGDSIYYGAGNGKVEGVDRVTGKKQWTHLFRDSMFNTISGVPLAQQDTLYWVTVNNQMFQAFTLGGKLIWERKLFEMKNAYPSQPFLEGPQVFLTAQDGWVYAYEIKKK